MNRFPSSLTVRSILLALACCPAVQSAPSHRYVVTGVTVTDLGTLGGGQSSAADINDSGQIVGWAATGQGLQHAFLYSSGIIDDIGAAFGPAQSEAAGINSSGSVAGTMTDRFGTLGFVWNAGSATMLFPSSQQVPLDTTHAAAINDNGDVCGFIKSVISPTRPEDLAFWASGQLPIKLSIFSYANDLNSFDMVVGHSYSGPTMLRWNASGVSKKGKVIPTPAGTGYGAGDALAINDAGDVVGHVALAVGAASVERAYIWDGASLNSQELGVLPSGSNSYAEDINELRFIAGHADEHIVQRFFDITHEQAFLYHRDVGMYALPVLPATTWLGSCRAFALNEWNPSSSVVQVVGACDTPSGSHAVRWDVTVQLVCVLCRP